MDKIIHKNSRKCLYISLLIFVSLLIFMPVPVYSKSNSIPVPSNKIWTIKFNKNVNFDSITKNVIKVTDVKGNLIHITLTLGEDRKSIIVNPPINGYDKDTEYILSIDTNIYSEDNKTMEKPYELRFTIDKTIYYVSPKGNDSNVGNISSPFRTIKHGINVLSQGDTLIIREGNYNELVDIYNKNGTSSQLYTIKNYPNETVILNGLGRIEEAFIFNNCSYWIIDGIQITDYIGAGIYIKDGCNNINMQNLTIWNLNPKDDTAYGVEGIMGEGNTSYCTVKNSEIFNVGLKFNKPKDHGIYIGYGAEYWTFDSNNIHDNAGAAIHMYGEPNGGSNCTITNNKLYNNHYWGLVMGHNSTKNKILNNIFYGNQDSDVYLLYSSTDNTFEHNIFGSYDYNLNIALDTTSINNVFDYNTYYKKNKYVAYRGDTSKSLTFNDLQKLSHEKNGCYINEPYNPEI